MASTGAQGAMALLLKEYRRLEEEKWLAIELKNENIMNWTIAIMVINSDSYYNGGYFKADMKFSSSYPYSPPEFRFLRPIFHPNIYPDGKVCISILHPPGEDEMAGELATERWSPLQGVESVLRSVLLLLDDPEVSSPANVDASVMYRNDKQAYIQKAHADVQKSKGDIPKGFIMPTTIVDAPPVNFNDDEDFWNDSDVEDDFGGSDSSGEDAELPDFDEDGEGDQEFDSESDAKDTSA